MQRACACAASARAHDVYVLQREATLSRTSSIRVPARYTVHRAGSRHPAHLVVFERRSDAVAYHAAMALFWSDHYRLPLVWGDVEDMLDHYYTGANRAAGPCPLAIDLEKLRAAELDALLRQNNLACVAVRSIVWRRSERRYVMTFALVDAPDAVDVSDKLVEMEYMYYMS